MLMFLQWGWAQNTHEVTLHFVPLFEKQSVTLEKKYASRFQEAAISFTVFKCYVSHFEFYANHRLTYSAADTAFLLDASKPESLSPKLSIPNHCLFDEVRFYFGIDDTTNHLGIGSGDLDPMKGMYWTWQTGYINMKLEGYCNNSSTSDHGFQFHLGGFTAPYVSFQPVTLKTFATDSLNIIIDLSRFMEAITLKDTNTVMSPGESSVVLSKNAATMFRLP